MEDLQCRDSGDLSTRNDEAERIFQSVPLYFWGYIHLLFFKFEANKITAQIKTKR